MSFITNPTFKKYMRTVISSYSMSSELVSVIEMISKTNQQEYWNLPDRPPHIRSNLCLDQINNFSATKGSLPEVHS